MTKLETKRDALAATLAATETELRRATSELSDATVARKETATALDEYRARAASLMRSKDAELKAARDASATTRLERKPKDADARAEEAA